LKFNPENRSNAMHRDDQNRSAEFIPLPSSKVTAVPPHRMGRDFSETKFRALRP